MNSLVGRGALIFGGKTGIGEAVARQLRSAGARVLVADIDAGSAQATDGALLYTDCDVRDAGQVQRAVQTALSAIGKIDILVNNAGVGMLATAMQEIDDESWEQLFEVNFRGTLFAMRAVIPHMIGRKYGRIINTASQLAHKPAPMQAAYCSSKAAVVALSVSTAQEVAVHGITVNCVCPGPTDTRMWHASDDRWKEWKLSQLPIRRLGSVDEIASAYLYLASEEAAYMVGQSVSPNGGDVMW